MISLSDSRLILLGGCLWLLLAFACSAGPGDAEATGNERGAALQSGIDGSPVPVSPFFNGVFPPREPRWPGSVDWDVVPAFPNLNLSDTLVIVSNPADGRMYVGSRAGLLVSFENQHTVSTTRTLIDLRDRVAAVFDGGLLGLAFHPEFGDTSSPQHGVFYVYYSTHCPLDSSRNKANLAACDNSYPDAPTEGFFNTYLRLSRFELVEGSDRGDPASEQVLLNIRLYNTSHRSGGMLFRNDGYLYLTIGDQFRYETAQDIVDTLEGGMLRLAVDVTVQGSDSWSCPPGSHLPRRAFDTPDEISGRFYCIPNDNPWLNPAGEAFEEYCSIGHRNPHRIAWDKETDRIWTGEVGEVTREEINLVECGNNYGWPFREGFIEGVGPEPASYLGVLTDPVIDFTRDEARALIGGYVYRGAKFPELYGRYLVGDYVTNKVWAVTLDETTGRATKVHLADFYAGNLSTWGQDQDGEVFMGDVRSTGPLYMLERRDESVPDAPELLSETGAFSNILAGEPSSTWVPYDMNQSFWSDRALKHRYLALPTDGVRDAAEERIGFSATAPWSYPTGTVFMKHMELPLDESDPAQVTRLETRFLVLGEDEKWYGLSYRWRDDQRDAELLPGSASADYRITGSDGATRTQSWHFPSREDCMVCHQHSAGGAVGPTAHQLNGEIGYPSSGRTGNQLKTWNELGMFNPPLNDPLIEQLPRSVPLADVTAPTEQRARSWLDSNCAYCHQPGVVDAGFDARYTTPFPEQWMAWTRVRDKLGNPDTVVLYPGDRELSALWRRAAALDSIAMPPLAKTLVEQRAVDVLGGWIDQLDPAWLPGNGVHYEYFETELLRELPDFDSMTPIGTGTLSAFDLAVRTRDVNVAFRFHAYLYVDIPGEYVFYLSSDDGSQLFIDEELVVDNDGWHSIEDEASGTVTLPVGFHELVVTLFGAAGEPLLQASWEGPATDGFKAPISSSWLYLGGAEPRSNEPPELMNPGTQGAVAGAPAELVLQAMDPDADLLYFDAADLPEGLEIDSASGRIYGTVAPDALGSTTVTASVSDGPEVSVVTFDWLLKAPVCGDGIRDASEGCDDGNLEDGDGCNSDCGVIPEPGSGSGGGCSVGGGRPWIDSFAFLALLLLGLSRRRKVGRGVPV